MNLDAKGRLSVPTRHRDALMQEAGGQLTITLHNDGCLMVFPRPTWEVFREHIASLPMDARKWKRMYLGNAQDVEMDGTGRVLVAPELRQAAKLSRNVLLLGVGDHFELWDKARYEQEQERVMQEEVPDALKEFVF